MGTGRDKVGKQTQVLLAIDILCKALHDVFHTSPLPLDFLEQPLETS